MSAEPEDDNCAGAPLTPQEWAAWALMGDDRYRVPQTLAPLAERIAQVVIEGRRKDRADLAALRAAARKVLAELDRRDELSYRSDGLWPAVEGLRRLAGEG